ncbi:hypothetical protein F5877DRAFT_49504, partial [Lentinula edodes]
FRRILRRSDCPPLLKYCGQLINKVYVSTSRELLSLLDESTASIQCYRRCLTPFRNYYAIPEATGKANSFVCFFPDGDRQAEWVAGQIRHIFCENGKTRFAIRRSHPITSPSNEQDPFQLFWNQGFQAKMISSSFSNDLELVEYDWVLAHTARWELCPGKTVCLCLKVCLSALLISSDAS